MEDSGVLNNVDPMRFIGEIEKRPAIWNPMDENYHDRSYKRIAWMEVCRAFCEDYDQKDQPTRNQIYRDVFKKWRNIKDAYRKSQKNRKNGVRTTYVYARELEFLGDITQPKAPVVEEEERSESPLKPEDSQKQDNCPKNPEPDEDSEWTEENENGKRIQTPCRAPKAAKQQKLELEASLLNFLRIPMPIELPTIPTVAKSKEQDLDPDKAFFESIMPSISNFSEDQRLEFRSEIINVIRRIRMSHNE